MAPTTIGQNIKRLRERAGLSAARLVKEAKLKGGRQGIAALENGPGYPSLHKLIPIARVLGASLDEIVNGVTDEPQNQTRSRGTTSGEGKSAEPENKKRARLQPASNLLKSGDKVDAQGLPAVGRKETLGMSSPSWNETLIRTVNEILTGTEEDCHEAWERVDGIRDRVLKRRAGRSLQPSGTEPPGGQ